MPDPSVRQLEIRLLEQAAAGEADARRALFERHRAAAYRVALRITGRHEDALDVTQDAFIRAFEKLDSFERGASFKTWLLRIASNRALDLLRKRRVRVAAPLDNGEEGRIEPAAPINPPESGMEREEIGARIRLAMEKLPPDQRAVISLYGTGELTYGEIAETLGVPIGTVMSRLFHARKKLADMLPDLAPTGGRTKAAEQEEVT